MAAAYDWTSFRIFDDDCVLDAGSLGATDLNDGCLKFDTWLSNLRGLANKPSHCGIPVARVGNVTDLLNKFFPVNQPFLNIAYQTQGNNPTYYPDPVTVLFGNATIDINDGPSALSYIFSIANRPAAGPGQPPLPAKTFSNHGLPLFTIFTRWIYLTYIRERNNAQVPQGQAEGMVPFMTCLMYTLNNNDNFQCFMGSSYVTNGVDPLAVVDGYQKRRIMNIWRRQEVLDNPQGLSYYNPSRVNNLPILPPVMAESVGNTYFLLLRGNTSIVVPQRTLYQPPDPNNPQGLPQPAIIQHTPSLDVCKAVFDPTAAILAAAWKNLGLTPPIRPMSLENVAGSKVLRRKIRAALAPIIQLRFNPPGVYSRQDPQLQALFKDLIRDYYMPHMFKTKKNTEDDFNAPEVDNTLLTEALAIPIQTFWTAHGDAMLDVLDNLYYWVTTFDDSLMEGGPSLPRFGRCAETHPVVAVISWCYSFPLGITISLP
ncbi:hypothetical protein EDB81DRAFT_759571 [Dactylonectria macrodidyma]|uniref:Uncharacterized protein n=1 Tax=Dactylonectria macrodidyma TaxID=307937 RepID=A0A9P9J2C1_9HYPO|nr:hypothetical protein EDB81DRAFT_759571 [Dactylonectria macrodidyma]